ncbi:MULTISPECIES: phenylacetic acid degradation bifunctional protein PaaZ [Rhodopseudomonas]|uniref:Enoyl-CoA hydratase n=1 Tax=Rhodopseudomonas palustris TaxID=1076 RepID=A0A0D7EB66_RHOPL|nr:MULTISPECIES: phenylacetic acid degradation bifunctional protein PaaZ [Rhodopseudomonas]KIZ38104.1 enoyl-CoA hydratase [Rhodopseudomonas palustris]MDF3812223.1 phenylacetic acid degradation bifunctional protein PaaZ [Rhodopseudomonas sp. BAL398]WOK18071.1 phenylacetic acid degradation bifunctional protein PaaZ [Rhodopseudomonas sp. BAL398]
MTITLQSLALDHWVEAAGGFVGIDSAVDGAIVARASSAGLDFAAMAKYAREVGGPALRQLSFHQRADLLRALAAYLTERKEPLYRLAIDTGANRRDNAIDIDGGLMTLSAYASRGRRDLPDAKFVTEGDVEALSKRGGFVGQHILSPLRGVAVHINAFNFPCWGLLEKLAPALLAGVPVIVKPATATAYVAEALVRLIHQSGLLPKGALQLICGGTGDLLDHLGGQDVISFTGSIETSDRLRSHPNIARHSIRFIAERDSLNAAMLGPDVTPEAPEFDLFIREVVREMTVKAGQKCTAIRRILVPRALEGQVITALQAKLAEVKLGDPRRDDHAMGPLVSRGQRDSVRAQIAILQSEAEIVFGDPAQSAADGVDSKAGAYLAPVLLRATDPMTAKRIHDTEAFGPVATLIAYDDVDQAIELIRRGEGSLVASLFTYNRAVAEAVLLGIAPWHGRLLIIDRDCAAESTGHGSPLPQLLHGGPGRAGGGEELGGLRSVVHYMQRTAVQCSPARLAALTGVWGKGAPAPLAAEHPFKRDYDHLAIGDSIETASRPITLDDIEHFAAFTGDNFYAHMDEAAAKANPFFPGRVAHGYLILAFAAGLFVDPAPGPLLANYGLDNLRFLKPVSPDDTIRVKLTVKQKSPARKPDYGEVRWDVEVFNQNDEPVARYDLLTMSARAA